MCKSHWKGNKCLLIELQNHCQKGFTILKLTNEKDPSLHFDLQEFFLAI